MHIVSDIGTCIGNTWIDDDDDDDDMSRPETILKATAVPMRSCMDLFIYIYILIYIYTV